MMVVFTYLQHKRLTSALQVDEKNGIQCKGASTPAVITGSKPRPYFRATYFDLCPVSLLQRHDKAASASVIWQSSAGDFTL